MSLLGTWAVGYEQDESPPFVPDFGGALGAAEVVLVPFDHLGIPWASFDGPTNSPASPPGPWLRAVDDLVAEARGTGRPWVMALRPTSAEVDALAADAREEGGQLIVNPAWRPTCFDPANEPDPSRVGARYGRYAAWLVARARPDFVVIGARLNLYEANCGGAAYASVLDVVAAASARIRALAELEPVPPQEALVVPPIVAGLDVEDLYGLPSRPGRCAGIDRGACLQRRAVVIESFRGVLMEGAGRVDVVGVESYPAVHVVETAGGEIPARYLSDALDAIGEGAKAIIGAALPAQSVQSRQGPCVPFFEGSEEAQARWLDLVLAAGRAHAMPFVLWRTAVDLGASDALAACPCAGDAALCQHLGTLGARTDARRLRLLEGLSRSDGLARAAHERWRMEIE